jgi:UDP-glucose 4-epimerase
VSAVLLTGGAGYIGSHTAVELMSAGRDVVVLDNFDNSNPAALDRVAELVPGGRLARHRGDVADVDLVTEVLRREDVGAVVHFAGLKAVGESVADPLRYYEVNVAGTMALLRAMDAADVRTLVFSSSCTVYGSPERVPVDETAPIRPASPYGRTKAMVESILADLVVSDDRWGVVALRYFNPVGAHPSGRIGEDPVGTPGNLMPFTTQVAAGLRPCVRVFGDDYPTPDGTGVRDYIHVMDLAAGHDAALAVAEKLTGFEAVNLGTGTGSSVLEVIAAASAACGRQVPYEVVDRRPGDVAASWADPARAHELLGWRATRGLAEMAADHWRWQEANPTGYPKA